MSGVFWVSLRRSDCSQTRYVDLVSLPLSPTSGITGVYPMSCWTLFIFYFYFRVPGHLPTYVRVLQAHACCRRRAERGIRFPELEGQVMGIRHVGAGSRAWVLSWSGLCCNC